MNQLNISELQQILASANNILIAIPKNPTLDKVAASLSLYLSLKKSGKKTVVVCEQAMTVEFSQLVGVDKISKKMNGRNLIISFNYIKDSIEKVSYNVEGNKFNLIIQPKIGSSPLDAKNVSYSYSGGNSDLIFVIGAQRLENLGSLYENEKDFYGKKPIINIDNQSQNTQFGKINIFEPRASSHSEIITSILKDLDLPFDRDIANNLLAGIRSATDNFQSPYLSPESFEAAAFCLRTGMKQTENSEAKNEQKETASSDWLAPKIYKGSTRV